MTPSQKRFFVTGFRTLVLLSLLLPITLLAEIDLSKTVTILTANFANGTPEVQKRVLREVGILRAWEAIPFLASVAVSDAYENDVRRDALKSMLATNGRKYRPVLKPLKAEEILTSDVVLALLAIGDTRFSDIFCQRAAEEGLGARDLRVAVITTLDFWNGEERGRPQFERWKEIKASRQLVAIAKESSGIRKRRSVAAMGWVRDKESTNYLIRMLDGTDTVLLGLAIEGLGNSGSDPSPALGRFLMKSDSPRLRDQAVNTLMRINTEASKRALKAYKKKK